MTNQPSRRAKGHLPAGVTSFVGRRRDLHEVRRLLTRTRLLTLVGVGGVGKTRLALCAAHELRRAFADGVWFVDLAPLKDERLLAGTVASTLGLADRSARSPVDSLVEFVQGKRLLLVLDNCEHVLDACASLTGSLLRAAPGVRMLATSRQPLVVDGEAIFEVPPLSLPPACPASARELEESEAVRLLEDRASAAGAGLSVTEENRVAVARLCRRLDGIPLAIELAAVRLRHLSMDTILKRLDDRFRLLTRGSRAAPPRQQTLRATIDWSYELCSMPERVLWQRLSVFSGEFGLDAVEEICGDDAIPRESICEVLSSLIDKSLVVREVHEPEARYRLLDSIQQYGLSLLARSGEEERVRRRHRDFYQRLVIEAEKSWFSPHQMPAYARLRQEHANARSALELCLTERGKATEVFRMVSANWDYWVFHGILCEGRYWLTRALTQDRTPTPARARALWVAGRFALLQNDLVAARTLLNECRRESRRANDPSSFAQATEYLGMAALYEGDHPRAAALMQEALNRHREIGDLPGIRSNAAYRLALALSALGDTDRAVALGQEAIAMSRACGADPYRALAQWALALDRYRHRRTREAAALLCDAVRIQRSVHDRWNTAQSIEVLAWISADEGEYRHSARILGAAHMLWRSLATSVVTMSPFADFHDRCESVLRKELGDEKYLDEFHEGAGLSVDQAIQYALDKKIKPDSGKSLENHVSVQGITPREQEIAALVAQGKSNREISADLVIALRTAEGHVENILKKLGFSSRVEIASWYTRRDTRPP